MIFGLFPITLSSFSHLFNSQWRSGCVLDFHSNVLSSIPSIITFLKNFVSVHSLLKALEYCFPLVVRLKPLFRKISWPRGCVGGQVWYSVVLVYLGSVPGYGICSALELIKCYCLHPTWLFNSTHTEYSILNLSRI